MLEAMADQTQAPDELKAAPDQAAAPEQSVIPAKSNPAKIGGPAAVTVAPGDTQAQSIDGLETTLSISDAVNTQPKAGVKASAQPRLH